MFTPTKNRASRTINSGMGINMFPQNIYNIMHDAFIGQSISPCKGWRRDADQPHHHGQGSARTWSRTALSFAIVQTGNNHTIVWICVADPTTKGVFYHLQEPRSATCRERRVRAKEEP
jgi:hypothetical protein